MTDRSKEPNRSDVPTTGIYPYGKLGKQEDEERKQNLQRDAAIDIVFTAVYERTTRKYGERGIRYVHMEAGHAAQNVYLQAVSLDLGTVVTGAFMDDQVKELVNAGEQEKTLYIMPVGRKG